MKRLMIMRHADAGDPVIGQNDRQRMLSRKGRSDMQRLHTQLLAEGLLPQFAVASDAYRTEVTMMEVTGNHDFKCEITSSASLYNAGPEKIIGMAQSLSDEYESALIVAHNPGVYTAVMELVSEMDLNSLTKKLGNNYKSGTLTVFECPIEKWSDLKLKANKLAKVFIPD